MFNDTSGSQIYNPYHEEFYIPPLKATLCSMTCALMCFLLILFISQLKFQNDLKSWSFAFYLLCFAWLTFRTAFWFLTIISTEDWPEIIFYILYWFPNPIEFGDFMILPLFYFQVLYERLWKIHMAWIMTVYVLLVVVLLLCYFLWAVVAAYYTSHTYIANYGYGPYVTECTPEQDGDQLWFGERAVAKMCMNFNAMSGGFRLLTASCYLLLASSLSFLCIQVTKKKNRWVRKRFMIKGPKTLLSFNMGLVLIFFSRVCYNVGSYFKLWNLPEIPLSGSSDVYPSHFIAYFIWDFLPAFFALLIITAQKRPITAGSLSGTPNLNLSRSRQNKTRQDGKKAELHDFSLFRDIYRDALSDEFWDGSRKNSMRSVSSSYGKNAGSFYQSIDGNFQGENFYSSLETPRWISAGLNQGSVFDDPKRYWRGSATSDEGIAHSPSMLPANKGSSLLPSPMRYPLERIQQSQSGVYMEHISLTPQLQYSQPAKSIRPRAQKPQLLLFAPNFQLDAREAQQRSNLGELDALVNKRKFKT